MNGQSLVEKCLYSGHFYSGDLVYSSGYVFLTLCEHFPCIYISMADILISGDDLLLNDMVNELIAKIETLKLKNLKNGRIERFFKWF